MSDVPPPSELPPIPPSDSPPGSPPGSPPPPPPLPPVDPAKQVQAPAYGLMGAATVFVLWDIWLIGGAILSIGFGAMNGGGKLALLFGGGIRIVWILLNLAIAGFIFYGATQMLKLRNYNLALTAAILAMLPCSWFCCCWVNLGLGIWALVILLKPEVKAAFNNGPTGGFPAV